MKDRRIIKIRNPLLRKIRDEFRLLWHAALNSRWNEIFDEMERIDSNENGRLLTVEEMEEYGVLERYRFLQVAKNELSMRIKLSICQCATCGRADRDMYYNKTYNAWWCTDCAGLFKTMHPHMKEKYASKDPRFYDYDEEFGKSFL